MLCIAAQEDSVNRKRKAYYGFNSAILEPNDRQPVAVIAVLLTLGIILVNGWTDAPNAIATLAGVLFFRERLQKLQWFALAAIIAALFLLNI